LYEKFTDLWMASRERSQIFSGNNSASPWKTYFFTDLF